MLKVAMADIFLSYARGDRQKAESLARALQGAGWSVWWDRSILPGSSYEQVIAHELSAARCVVVLWSTEALESNWVRDEATLAQTRKVLVSALIDNTDLPLGFRQQQAANLRSWTGSTTDSEFQLLTQGIAAVVAGSGAAGLPAPAAAATRHTSDLDQTQRGASKRMTLAGVSALVVMTGVLIGAVMWLAGYRPLRDGAPRADGGSTVSQDSPTSQALVVHANAEATLAREAVTLTVLSGQFERLNAGTRRLTLHIRFANDGTRTLDRTYYTDLRLLVDGVPRAPTSAPLEQIETSSAREFDYVFEVPATAARAVLRVSRNDESSDIPLDFTVTRR
jgi:hypothetical protein